MVCQPLSPDPQRAVTNERLRLLALGFYISGTIGILTVSLFIIHFVMFSMFSLVQVNELHQLQPVQQSVDQESDADNGEQLADLAEETKMLNSMMVVMAGLFGVIIIFGWVLGGLTIYAGRCISKRKQRTLVLILSGVNCVWIPYGTLLGVSAFLTLSHPDAKEEYPS